MMQPAEVRQPGRFGLVRDSSDARANMIAVAGIIILGLSAAAALLPLTFIAEVPAVSAMMIAAGTLEIVAGSLRGANRAVSIVPGAVTVLGGLFLAFAGMNGFVPVLIVVAAWLGARAASLSAASIGLRRTPLIGTVVAAVTDLTLAAILMIWLSATTFPLWMFGATRPILFGFAWVFAVSFLATGMLLLTLADVERRPVVETRS